MLMVELYMLVQGPQLTAQAALAITLVLHSQTIVKVRH